MCRDPLAETEAVLIVEPEPDYSLESLEQAITTVGGTVESHLQHGAIRVSLTEERVTDLCSLDGIAAVETDAVVGIGGDSGEDI